MNIFDKNCPTPRNSKDLRTCCCLLALLVKRYIMVTFQDVLISNKIEAHLCGVQTVHWQTSQAISILKILLPVTQDNLLTDHLRTLIQCFNTENSRFIVPYITDRISHQGVLPDNNISTAVKLLHNTDTKRVWQEYVSFHHLERLKTRTQRSNVLERSLDH